MPRLVYYDIEVTSGDDFYVTPGVSPGRLEGAEPKQLGDGILEVKFEDE